MLRLRRLGAMLAGGLVLAAMTMPARADFPERGIRVVVPFAAGGTMDMIARSISAVLAERINQTVTVENVTGGGTVIGTQRVVTAPADGYTLLFQSGALAIDVTYRKNPSYDVRTNLAPITKAAWDQFAVLVSPQVPAKTLREFAAYSKANPGKLNYGSSGAGAGIHLIQEYLKAATGIDATHIPFRGEAPATTALLAGEVQMTLKPPFNALPLVEDGKVRALAVTGSKRSHLLPDVSTVEELGYGKFFAGYWGGFLAPAGTPEPVIARLNAELVAAIRDPRVAQVLRKQGIDVIGNSPQVFRREIDDEIELWRKTIVGAGIATQ